VSGRIGLPVTALTPAEVMLLAVRILVFAASVLPPDC
jgi:hypothetical protein